MGHKFTEQIKEWLEAPEAERDYSVGAKKSNITFVAIAEISKKSVNFAIYNAQAQTKTAQCK